MGLEQVEDVFDVDVAGDEIAGEEDFLGVVRANLDDGVVDFGGDLVAIVAGKDDGEGEVTDGFEEGFAGGLAAGEDEAGEAGGGHVGFGVGGGEDDIFAVGWGDDEGILAEEALGVIDAHGADDDVIDDAVEGAGGIEALGLEFFGEEADGGVGEEGAVGDDAEEAETFSFEAALGELGDEVEFFGEDFIEDDADDFDAFLLEEGLVEGDFVDGFADAALGDDHDFGAEEFGDAGVGEVKDGADAGVAGAFAEDEVLFPGDAVEGEADALDEGIVVGGFEVAAGEIGFDRDGAHVDEGAIELVDVVHEDGVLVDFVFIDFDEALADRFDVADAGVVFLEGGEEAQGGGGFAVVLAGGGDEDAWGAEVVHGAG